MRASSDHRLYNTRGVIPTRTYGFNFRGRRTRTDRRIFFACVSAPRVSATKRESFANRAVRFPSFCWTGISVQRATDSGRRRIGRYGRCTRVVPVESKSTYVFGHFPNLFNDNARPYRLFYEIIFAVFPRASFYGSLFSTYARTNHVFDIYVRRPLRFRKIPVVINPLYRNDCPPARSWTLVATVFPFAETSSEFVRIVVSPRCVRSDRNLCPANATVSRGSRTKSHENSSVE